MSTGFQLFPDAHLVDLMKSWRIIKRITKTRAKPRLLYNQMYNGWIAYRNPRIHGEEYITKLLNAMNCTCEEVTFL